MGGFDDYFIIITFSKILKKEAVIATTSSFTCHRRLWL
jgi:hypothetical protein